MRGQYDRTRQQLVEDPIQPGTNGDGSRSRAIVNGGPRTAAVDARWYNPRDDRDRHYQ